MAMNSIEAAKKIEGASGPRDLFPDGPDSPNTQQLFRALALAIHPDRFNGKSIHGRMTTAFQRLNELRDQLSAPPPLPRIGRWSIRSPIVRGGISDLYSVATSDTAVESSILKIVRSANDNLLMAQEAISLKALHSNAAIEKLHRYFPKILDKFEASGRSTNVLSEAVDCLPLSHIRTHFPDGIPFVHVVWMANRLLSGIAAAHATGVIYGAALPNHLLYRLNDHGLVMVDWTCSVQFPSDGHIPLISKRWSTHYPVEVKRKNIYCATDIFMAAKSMLFAAGGIRNVPRRFRAWFDWTLAESPASRPGSAWDVQDRWRQLAKQEYGESRFVEFKLPAFGTN